VVGRINTGRKIREKEDVEGSRTLLRE